MDYNLKFGNIESQMSNLKTRFDVLKDEFDEAVEFTKVFLDECKNQDITLVSIGTRNEEIKSAKNWGFNYTCSVFADNKGKDGWPTIWSVVNKLGISGGCGNSGQHQITGESYARLVDGVYLYKDGKWSFKEPIEEA